MDTYVRWYYCDALFFAVDADFPRQMLPGDAGVIVADEELAEVPPRRSGGGGATG
jgi:hypothetical protein